MEEKHELSLYGDETVVTRSNEFIKSKYRATLLESKLLVLSICRLQNRTFGTADDLKVSFSAAELRTLLNEEDSKSIYQKLKYSASRLMKNFFVVQDKDRLNFKVSVIVKDCEYRDGVFTVEFNSSIREHIFKLTNNYTPMKLSILLAFSKGKTNSSYRIYEVLRTHLYKVKRDADHIQIKYDLYEFMLYTGQIDTNDDKVQAALEAGKSAEYIVENVVVPGKNGRNLEWRDFKRRVLDPAIEEINEISDITVSYTPVRGRKGAKVIALNFDISKRSDYSVLALDDFKVDADMLIKFEDLISTPMSTRDKTAIIKAAAGNFDRILQIYHMAMSQPEINNLVAWMIAGLKEGWDLQDEDAIHIVRGDYADEYQSYADAANKVIDATFTEVPAE